MAKEKVGLKPELAQIYSIFSQVLREEEDREEKDLIARLASGGMDAQQIELVLDKRRKARATEKTKFLGDLFGKQYVEKEEARKTAEAQKYETGVRREEFGRRQAIQSATQAFAARAAGEERRFRKSFAEWEAEEREEFAQRRHEERKEIYEIQKGDIEEQERKQRKLNLYNLAARVVTGGGIGVAFPEIFGRGTTRIAGLGKGALLGPQTTGYMAGYNWMQPYTVGRQGAPGAGAGAGDMNALLKKISNLEDQIKKLTKGGRYAA